MIDWQRIAELRDEIGDEDFDEVVELFLTEVEEALDTLPDAPEAAIEGLMHLLKGSAINLGFRAFAELCQEGEIAARQGDSAAVDRAAVRRLYDQSHAVFLRRTPA